MKRSFVRGQPGKNAKSNHVPISWSVLIGGDAEKIRPIDSALRGKLFNVQTTHYQTAQGLLKEGLIVK